MIESSVCEYAVCTTGLASGPRIRGVKSRGEFISTIDVYDVGLRCSQSDKLRLASRRRPAREELGTPLSVLGLGTGPHPG